MKKLVFSMAALAAFSFGANAEDGDQVSDNSNATESEYNEGENLKPNGVYGGLGISLTNNEWQQSTEEADWERWADLAGNFEPVPGRKDLLGVDHTNDSTRLSPVLFLGYGFLYKSLFIAPEIAVQLAPNVEKSNSRTDIIDGARRDSESWVRCNGVQPILALKIGYYCAKWNSVVYAKFGAIYKKFTFRDSEYYGDGWYVGENIDYVPEGEEGAGDNAHGIYFNNSKKFSNWRFLCGLGLSKALSKYVTVSGELTYTFGKKMKMTVEGSCQTLSSVEAGEDEVAGDPAVVTDRMRQVVQNNDKGSIGVGIYAQWNIWKPKN